MSENPKCPHCDKARRKQFPTRKRGSYTTDDGTARQRFECTNGHCGKTFTEAFVPADRGRRTDIDAMLFKLACSGVTIRRSATLLDVAVNTVRKRMAALAKRARAAHEAAASDPKRLTATVQFDEMRTFLNSRDQPLSIALAVRRHNGDILSAKVGTMSASGFLAASGRAKGWVDMNNAKATRKLALTEVKRFLRPNETPTFICDGLTAYRGEIRSVIGLDTAVENHVRDGDPHDPLFRLNHVCAKIRADLACMARDTWTTTKKVECLQDRLDIYVAWNNGYGIA